jgi:hypothetical protein
MALLFLLNYVIKDCAMKEFGGERKYNFTVLALDGSEWLASGPCRFTTRDISPIPIAWVPEPVFTQNILLPLSGIRTWSFSP